MKSNLRIVCVMLALLLPGSARAARLHFGQTNYTVSPGGTCQVQVYLDMNEQAQGDQMPATGLFTMGMKVTMDPLKETVQTVNDVVIPAAIDSDGAGGAAFREAGSGYARAYAGIVEWPNFYTNALLATVNIRNLAPGVHQLNLSLCYTGTVANFVDGLGNTLDGQVTNFVPATVTVQAAGAPVIQTVAVRTGNVLRVTFANTNFTASSLGVQSVTSLYPSVVWTTLPSVVIFTNSPGWYQVDLPQGADRRRYYRIQAVP